MKFDLSFAVSVLSNYVSTASSLSSRLQSCSPSRVALQNAVRCITQSLTCKAGQKSCGLPSLLLENLMLALIKISEDSHGRKLIGLAAFQVCTSASLFSTNIVLDFVFMVKLILFCNYSLVNWGSSLGKSKSSFIRIGGVELFLLFPPNCLHFSLHSRLASTALSWF